MENARIDTHENIIENDKSPRFMVHDIEPRHYSAHQNLHSSAKLPSSLATGGSYNYTNRSQRQHHNSVTALSEEEEEQQEEQEQAQTNQGFAKKAAHEPKGNNQYSNNKQTQEEAEFEVEKDKDDEPSEYEDQDMHQNDQFLNQLQSLISSDQQFGTKLLQLLINKEAPSGLENLMNNRTVSTGKKEHLKDAPNASANNNLLAGLLSSASSNSPSPLDGSSTKKKTKKRKSSKRTDLLREMLQEKSETNKQQSYKPSSFEQNLTMRKSVSPIPSSIVTHEHIFPAQTANSHFPLFTRNRESTSPKSFFGLKGLKENVSASIIPQRFPFASTKSPEQPNNNNTLRNNKSSGSSLKKVSSTSSPVTSFQPNDSFHSVSRNFLENSGPHASHNTYTKNTLSATSMNYKQTKIGDEKLDRSHFEELLPDTSATKISEKQSKDKEDEALKLKRKRNMEASARFRLRKKLRYKENMTKYENLVSDVGVLKNRIIDLTKENEFWKKKLKCYYDLKNKELLENIKSSI